MMTALQERVLRPRKLASASHGASRSRGRIKPERMLLYIILVLGTLPTLLPFVWLVRSALMGSSQIFTAPPEWIPEPFEWANFSGALTSVPFARYFLNTMIIEFFVIIGSVFSCSFAAFSFSRLRWRGRNVMFGILMTSVMLPYAVTLIPTFMLWKGVGALNTYLPLTVPAFFASGQVFNIFLLRQFFLTIPYELDEAAYIDGASPFKVFWKVILPLSKPALVVVTIFTSVAVWNDYLNPLIYLTDPDKFTLALGLASYQGQYTAQWGYLMAAATIVMLPVVALFFFAQRYFIEGVTLTGTKN